MAEHSPLPWGVIPSGINRDTTIRDANSEIVVSGLSEENARHIVRAVNAFEPLVKACEELLARVESDIESPIRKTAEGNLARAALSLAKGEKP